jgi:3-methyladenine DNA glycosylase AlkD
MSHKQRYPVAPRRATIQAVARLERLADTRVQRRSCTFFKKEDVVALYGVNAPAVHALVREIHDQVKHSWSASHAVAFCDEMVRRPHLEAKLVGFLLLGRFARQFTSGLLTVVETWLAEDLVDSWAAVDGLSTVTSPLLGRHAVLLPRILEWSGSPSRWQRRAAVVTFVPFARRGAHLPDAYRLVERLADDSEDLVHKACGWLLREAGKTDSSRLIRFLELRGRRLPRTTVRYAIERLPEPERQRLLTATRPPHRTGRPR